MHFTLFSIVLNGFQVDHTVYDSCRTARLFFYVSCSLNSFHRKYISEEHRDKKKSPLNIDEWTECSPKVCQINRFLNCI